MNETSGKQKAACFTGHRPEKLHFTENVIKFHLEKEIRKAIDDGISIFISGMARGVDIWAAEIVLQFRSAGEQVKLICAIPFEGFELGWEKAWQGRYQKIIKNADLVRYICHCYHRSCFQMRNMWMVDHSVRVIAVYNGCSGGTRNTIDYAQRKNIKINLING